MYAYSENRRKILPIKKQSRNKKIGRILHEQILPINKTIQKQMLIKNNLVLFDFTIKSRQTNLQ